ncbi:MAG: 5-(carboxyamino)imidazole ribonucleotide synthase [Acidimicrobiales bacterium]
MTASPSAASPSSAAPTFPLTLGILGGGQLGRMLAFAAARLGHRVIVLDPAADAPAGAVAEHLCAPYDDPTALAELAERCDVVTYEFENIPVAAVETIGADRVRPHPRALDVSADRLTEKQHVASIGLQPAPFRAADDQAQLEAAVGELAAEGHDRMVAKTRRLGYDGKGQLRLAAGEVPGDAFEQLGGVPLVVEGFVDFDCEISVIAARALDGTVRCFPPARNEHRDGILAVSEVPAGVDADVVIAAQSAAKRLLGSLDYVGVLGLELFVTADGLLVNEFAPRVHNSGHWSELASVTDQFEQHVRAVLGLPLGDPASLACRMENLIGDDLDRTPDLLAVGDWRVHVYGKAEARPGRKMGHATRLTGDGLQLFR